MKCNFRFAFQKLIYTLFYIHYHINMMPMQCFSKRSTVCYSGGVWTVARRVRALAGCGWHDRGDPCLGASRQARAFTIGMAHAPQCHQWHGDSKHCHVRTTSNHSRGAVQG